MNFIQHWRLQIFKCILKLINGFDGHWFMRFMRDLEEEDEDIWSPFHSDEIIFLHCINDIALCDLFPILPACIYRAAPLEWGWVWCQWPPCRLEGEWRVYGGRGVLRGNTHHQKLHGALTYTQHFTGSYTQSRPLPAALRLTAAAVVFVCVTRISESIPYIIPACIVSMH